MSLSAGQAFGNYRILSRIGVGGMGMVFLAEHPHIGKRVALKIIHRDLAGNREVVNRFLNEARAVNHIGSEHIVEIHDFGQTDDGEHFFIMEFLDGRTLAQELGACGALDAPRALHIGAQVASALAAAHDVNIIHRDLKPDNVMLIHRLGDPDFVKLLDFGLAKFLVDADARKLTAAGVVLGTPHYMSPEACESKPDVDHRCDIYSLGVLLFQMATGVLPFSGESMGEVLVKQVAHPPPAPRGINPDIPPAVEQVILRCLAKEPGLRFQTMRELRDALLDPTAYLSASPPVVPVSATADARTIFAGAPLGPPAAGAPADRPTEMALEPGRAIAEWTGRGAAGPSATAYMDEAAHRAFAGQLQHHVPQPVENRTMEIGTPLGYSNLPPPRRRRAWPLAATLVGAGAAIAVAALTMTRAGEREPSAAVPSARAIERPPPDAGPRTARIRLTTRPAGAEVIDEAGARVGTTPTEMSLPVDGREVLLRFRHPDTGEAEKRFVATADAAFDIELPPAPAAAPADAGPADVEPGGTTPDIDQPGAGRRAPERRRTKKRRNTRNDVLRPDF